MAKERGDKRTKTQRIGSKGPKKKPANFREEPMAEPKITPPAGGEKITISNGKLNGDQITFSVGATRYSGKVAGGSMEGTTNGGGQWNATKSSK